MDGCRFLFTAIILHVLTPVAPVTPSDYSCLFYVNNASTLEKTGFCGGMNLKEVPRNFGTGVVSKLSLQDTQITTLTEASFTTWTDIEALIADNNRIRMITEKAFKFLKKLRKLSLSNNQLILNDGVNSNVFRYITQLESLDLSHNPLGAIPNNFFKHLKRLRILRLNNARDGVKVKEYAFVGLFRLETLDLTSNFLRTLPEKGVKNSLSGMSLKNLYLGGDNYWKCDCHLRWLKVWQIQHYGERIKYKKRQKKKTKQGSIYFQEFPAMCNRPWSMKDKGLFSQEIQVSDFQCKPDVKTKPQNITYCSGTNVTLSCDIYSDPKCSVSWFKDNTLVQKNWPRIKISQTHGINFKSSLSIRNLKPADAGEWVCEAKNRRSRSSTKFTLHVTSGLSCSRAHLWFKKFVKWLLQRSAKPLASKTF